MPGSVQVKRIVDGLYLASSAVGATLVALNVGAQLAGYSLFLLSSVCALYLLRGTGASRSLMMVNGMFAVINLIGIIRA